MAHSTRKQVAETMTPQAFMDMFAPGEYSYSGMWSEVEDHPSFYEKNPFNPRRVHGATMPRLIASLKADGMKRPVLVNENNEVEDGHHRVVAAAAAGVPILFTRITVSQG